jgi:hypothetical protein
MDNSDNEVQVEQEFELVGIAESAMSRVESAAVVAPSGGRGLGVSVARFFRGRRDDCHVSPEQGSQGADMQPKKGVRSRVASTGMTVASALTRIIGKAGRDIVSISSNNSPKQRTKTARYEAGGDIENDVNEFGSNGARQANSEKYDEDTVMGDNADNTTI